MIKIMQIKILSAHDLRWESVIEVAPPGHTIAYKSVDELLKKLVRIYSDLLCNLNYDV